MKTIYFRYGSTRGTISFNGGDASAPILLDGDSTGYQTADARHSLERAVQMVLERAFGGPVDLADVVLS